MYSLSSSAKGSVTNFTPHSGHSVDDAGIHAPHWLHFAVPVSKSTPHLGHFFELSGIKAPHSPHSTSLPSFLYMRKENTTITNMIRMIISIQIHIGSMVSAVCASTSNGAEYF